MTSVALADIIQRTMKKIEFNFNGRKYRMKPAGLALLIIAVLAVIIVILLAVANVRSRKHLEEAIPAPTATPAASYEPSANTIAADEYDGTVLAKTEDAGSDYIDSTLFLGDSNTARFLTVADPDTGKPFTTKENTIGVVGMGIDAISSLPVMDFTSGRYTMPQAVKILQPERVIITFGTNNLSGSSTETKDFIKRYEAQLKQIVDAYPSVDLIVNSIPPVAKRRSYPNVTMQQIDAYNKAIARMCENNGWKYLNSSEALKDAKSGYAKKDYMVSDGLHLSPLGLKALFTYARTHAWISEDDRPKPLQQIPGIIGVPEGLIKTDPLTDAEFTEDPSAEGYEETEEGCLAMSGHWNAEEGKCYWAEEPEETATPTPDAQETPAPGPSATVIPSPTPTPLPTQTAAPEPTVVPSADPYAEAKAACKEPDYWDDVTNTCVIVPVQSETPVPSAGTPVNTETETEGAKPAESFAEDTETEETADP